MKKTYFRGFLYRILLSALLLACFFTAGASAKEKKTDVKPESISLNHTSVTNYIGATFRLKATILPKKAASGARLIWRSSNEKVATVSEKGVVTLTGAGTARIAVKTKNGKKAVCIVKVQQYSISGRTVRVGSPEGVKTYYAYSQRDYGNGWYRHNGCVTTAVAIVGSAYGIKHTPREIHEGKETLPYTEKYAVKKMRCAYNDNAAISVRTASEILKNMGIQNRPVYSFDRAKALQEIREHLKQGKPVIIKANDNRYNGIRIANPHHAVVIVAVAPGDRAICISPGNPMYYTAITLNTLLYHHMTPASGNYMGAYMTELRTAGGYILVDGLKEDKDAVSADSK